MTVDLDLVDLEVEAGIELSDEVVFKILAVLLRRAGPERRADDPVGHVSHSPDDEGQVLAVKRGRVRQRGDVLPDIVYPSPLLQFQRGQPRHRSLVGRS